jgi:hypothetical protein
MSANRPELQMRRCVPHVATSALCAVVALVPLSPRAHPQGAREVPSAVARDAVKEGAVASPKVTCATLRADGSWVDATLSADGSLVAPDGGAAMPGALAVLGPDGRALLAGRQRRPAFRAVSGQSELILADGQRMPGALAGAFTDPQGGMRVVWKHLGLGAIDVPLDRVAGFSLQGGAAIPLAQSADVVRLANGDTIEGLVERIGEVFVVEQDGQRREIPVDRIASCGFVTSPAPRLPVRVWHADGTILDGTELKPVGDLAFALAGPAVLQGRSLVVLTAEEMHGAMLAGGADARIMPLAAIVPAVEAVDGAQLSTSTPQVPAALDGTAPLGLASLEIRGPVRLVYGVPKGSERLVGELSVRDRLREWAHAPVVVKQGNRQLLSGTLDAATPTLALDIRLDPALSGSDAALSIEVGEGQRAAIGDVLVLDRGALIVRGSGGS